MWIEMTRDVIYPLIRFTIIQFFELQWTSNVVFLTVLNSANFLPFLCGINSVIYFQYKETTIENTLYSTRKEGYLIQRTEGCHITVGGDKGKVYATSLVWCRHHWYFISRSSSKFIFTYKVQSTAWELYNEISLILIG